MLSAAIVSQAASYAYRFGIDAREAILPSTTIGPPLTGKAFKDFTKSCDGGAVIDGIDSSAEANPHYNSTCYYWVCANQQNNEHFSAEGVSARFSQNNPEVGESPTDLNNHSLAEIWAGSAQRGQAIEVGWTKSSGDNAPKLFATHWIDGNFEGYANSNGESNGFVSRGSGVEPGDSVKVGATGEYGIEFSAKHDVWEVLYNNKTVGDFPESLWEQRKTSFTSIGYVTIYGEVALALDTLQPTEMGSGVIDGPDSADVQGYRLYGSRTHADFSSFYVPGQGKSAMYYNLDGQQATGTSFSYGGPGKINFLQQQAESKPAW